MSKNTVLVDPEKVGQLMCLHRPDLIIESTARVQRLRLNIAKDVVSAKRAVDELTHPDLAPSHEENVELFKDQFLWFKDRYGEYSTEYTSICKMIVPFELPRSEIIREVKKDGELPAAFNQSLIAESHYWDAHICSFASEAVGGYLNDPELVGGKYLNCRRLARKISRRFSQYMNKLGKKGKKLYLLKNGSHTRFKDGPDLQDINGMIYITRDELERVKTAWKPIIDYFRIANFDDSLAMIIAENVPEGTYGSINYAPDDSGKKRISYCIDPAVQVVSKAIHEALDYAVKDLACNGTYRQMTLPRNMIWRGYHKTALCVSTDMTKYSDTLQFTYIEDMLRVLGIPEDVVLAIRDLYTLPMWDSVLRKVTPRTTASYQGQYGDFPMITLVNLWNQCLVYDFVNYNYGCHYVVELDLKKDRKTGKLVSYNSTNSAVGDDTMLIFPNPPDCLNADIVFNVIRAVFNRCGVNINKSKTHILDRGKGCCDFVKRVITCDGLVPYFRVEGICGSFDEQCAELLRFYRDNIISEEEFLRYCVHFLGEKNGHELYNLHPINGGVIDRPINELDLKRFIRRNESLNCFYSNRHDDELRLWIKHIEAEGIDLSETALVGFVDRYAIEADVAFSDTEDGSELILDVDDHIADYGYKEVEYSHESVKKAILKLNTCGFEHFHLTGIQSFIGRTLAEIRALRPEVGLFLDDYQQAEAYRYMVSRSTGKLTTYTDMFSDDFLPFEIEYDLYRIAYSDNVNDVALYKVQYLSELLERRCDRVSREGSYWGRDYLYYHDVDGQRYRMYKADKSKYPVITFSQFKQALGCTVSQEREEELRRTYLAYIAYLA